MEDSEAVEREEEAAMQRALDAKEQWLEAAREITESGGLQKTKPAE